MRGLSSYYTAAFHGLWPSTCPDAPRFLVFDDLPGEDLKGLAHFDTLLGRRLHISTTGTPALRQCPALLFAHQPRFQIHFIGNQEEWGVVAVCYPANVLVKFLHSLKALSVRNRVDTEEPFSSPVVVISHLKISGILE